MLSHCLLYHGEVSQNYDKLADLQYPTNHLDGVRFVPLRRSPTISRRLRHHQSTLYFLFVFLTMDVGDLDFDFDDEGSAARDGPGGGLVRAAEVSLGGRFGGVLFPGGFAAAGEPASSTAAVRQRRGESSGGARPSRDPLSKPEDLFRDRANSRAGTR